MATLDEKITRVENNVAASLEAAAEMGAEVPEGANSDSLPNLIRSIPKGGGASSWNDLPDRPVVLEGTPDTVTWDGNTEGRATFTVNTGIVFYKVSDAVPKFDELPASVNIKYYDTYGDSSWDGLRVTQRYAGVVGHASGWVWFVDQEGVGHTFANGDTIPEPGTYFMVNPIEDRYTVVTSLTIPGYTGFATEKFDPAYLYQQDWNQTDEAAPDFVKNKPFYEETTTVGGDTLTWDGNTEGLVSTDDLVEMFGTLYKISDAVPTLEDCVNGVTFNIANSSTDGVDTSTYEEINERSAFMGCLWISDPIFVVPENNYTIEPEGIKVTFPEAGIYTSYPIDDGYYLKSITIPGYTGFVTTETVIKHIDQKFLPEPLQFGETVVGGDTLTWDGVSGAVEIPDLGIVAYRVSDVVITPTDAESGAVVNLGGYETEFSLDDFEFDNNGYGALLVPTSPESSGFIMFVPQDNFEAPDFGITLPSAGIWVFESIPFSLTIPGYTGFVTKTVKPLNKKYLPGDLIPAYTAEDEGKVLKIVNGAPTWVSIPNAEEASF